MFASMLGPQEVIVLLLIGVLLFGKKLPEVGHSLGRAFQQFKRGLSGMEDEIGGVSLTPGVSGPYNAARPPQRLEAPAPKFQDEPQGAPPSA
jgi:sec-independent protein translocase protein TatA